MGKNQLSYDKSNDSFLKKTSYEYHMRLGLKKGQTNPLSVQERDYMIKKAVENFKIIPRFQPAVARAANYLTGVRFWEIYEKAQKAKSPAHYFIRSINKELYS